MESRVSTNTIRRCLVLELNTTFAERFHLLEKAGEGGTAHVYKAFDSRADSIVALKVFSSGAADQGQIDEFWHRESTALRRLSHPCIVKFVDAGRDDRSGYRYIAIEWFKGKTLENLLRDAKPVSWAEFYQKLGKDILDALCHAFSMDVSHRDVSLRNILVDDSGHLKIIDFGQAKVSDIGIGKTVAGWKTAPYCPPEDDTGRFTHTRDSYSFCAIALRAISGVDLKNHDDLYDVYDKTELPPNVRSVFKKALSREPKERYRNVLETSVALDEPSDEIEEDSVYSVAIRCVPEVEEKLRERNEFETEGNEGNHLEDFISELNAAVAVYQVLNESGAAGNRIGIETQSYRLVLDLDVQTSDHLVVIGLKEKIFQLNSLWNPERWLPQVTFTSNLPKSNNLKLRAKEELTRFYSDFETFLQTKEIGSQLTGSDLFSQWSRLLEALRHIEKNRISPLLYSAPEVEGRRLTVEINNPEDAEVGQLRVISQNGKWYFRGEIEALSGSRCTLYSNWARISEDDIPRHGTLEIDWLQARTALERQSRALERFKEGAVPGSGLRELVSFSTSGKTEQTFQPGLSFFDQSLDPDKKTIVSQCLATPDLFLIHGPPGTGKTTVIVEIIQQTLKKNPASKILLVSQTHVAIDNALEKLLRQGTNISVVRIGSGTKELSQGVKKCSVDERGKQLRMQVEKSTELFLDERAKEIGVDLNEVRCGIRALDVLRLQKVIVEKQDAIRIVQSEVDEIKKQLDDASRVVRTTRQIDEAKLRASSLENEVSENNAELDALQEELAVAVERLIETGKQGNELSKLGSAELSEWCDRLVQGEKTHDFRRLLDIAEGWRLKFGKSDDFKTAIIASSQVVAGTCLGFCREAAASSTEFDVCIVDEASKATTTELLVPLSQARKAILIGDHYQLPAVIDFALRDPEIQQEFSLTSEQLEAQLFELLESKLSLAHKAGLYTQYRMCDRIGQLVSECFYDNNLKSGRVESADSASLDLTLAGIRGPITWCDTGVVDGAATLERRIGTSFVNPAEAECILTLLRRLSFVFANTLKGAALPSIAIISSYAAQAAHLRREISRDPKLSELNIACDTVHAFQGREVNICFYSITRNNRQGSVGFLQDWRHLNVALSRARDNLVIVGSLKFCKGASEPNPFAKLVSFVEKDRTNIVEGWHGAK